MKPNSIPLHSYNLELGRSSILILLLLFISNYLQCNAQIVSHELRRLAVSTNQFGIDALKALDRIDPPDKVLVFCPVCLSSSLMMIMMGSSKYQVVSSLRHALYVWSMKPQDINRGFKDIFEHIGLNQQQQSSTMNQIHNKSSDNKTRGASRSLKEAKKPSYFTTNGQFSRSSRMDESLETKSSFSNEQYLSLPKLMRVREFAGRTSGNIPWWTLVGRKSNNGSRDLKENQNSSSNETGKMRVSSTNKDESTTEDLKFDHRESGDLSQMSAISNIYIQRGLSMNYNYNLLLRHYYKTVIHPVDFIRNGEETRQHINSLVAANTEGKIKDLVKRDNFEITKNPRIMIISTFHFRGTLDIQMKNTKLLDSLSNSVSKIDELHRSSQNASSQVVSKFQQTSRGQVFIETDETLLKYGYFSNLDCSVVEIPFNNRLVSLVVVMPNHPNSTELLLTKLSAQILSDMINSLSVKKLSIEIPVIKFDRGPVNVEGILKELGLEGNFFNNNPKSSETGLNKWMKPADIIHETSIDIGTINPGWSQTEDRLKVGAHEGGRAKEVDQSRKKSSENNHVKLDKTFFYFVLDTINGLVLTMGRIRQ